MHRRQTQNLTPLLPPQLLAHQTRKSTPNRLPALVNQHASVVIEFHHAAVRARVLLGRPHDYCVPDVAAADFVGGADGDAAAGAGFGAEVALFLYDNDDAVAWGERLGEFERVEGGMVVVVGGLDLPTLAARFILRTLMHSATAAPELSMTLSMD